MSLGIGLAMDLSVGDIVPRLLHWSGLEVLAVIAGWLLWSRMAAHAELRRRESRVQLELQAYTALDVRLSAEESAEEDVREMAGRVCRAMSEKSAFRRVGLLVRGADERLAVAASIGMEEQAVQALAAWGKSVVAEEHGCWSAIRREACGLGVEVGTGSFAVVLGKTPDDVGTMRAVVVPMWTASGELLGVLAVGADGILGIRRSVLRDALAPLEGLAMKVARSLENSALMERLIRAEKLAGFGLLASGMAHALSNPLTAVLGFAELIGGTTGEARVREDAAVIVREARKMRQVVESLLEFWRPAEQGQQPVDVAELVRELAAGCADRLEHRGVRLVVQGGGEELLVHGNRLRLRHMLEHLLNNAAQALASGEKAAAGEEQAIRLSVNRQTSSAGAERVQLMVSDTGPGFRKPGQMFDPFALEEVAGAGVGLSLCYGIVHEHGGEIRAFNLEPHGAAVAVELPGFHLAAKRNAVGAAEMVLR